MQATCGRATMSRNKNMIGGKARRHALPVLRGRVHGQRAQRRGVGQREKSRQTHFCSCLVDYRTEAQRVNKSTSQRHDSPPLGPPVAVC